MAKFYGAVGYAHTVDGAPGVKTEQITEKLYVGDIVRANRRLQEGENVRSDISLGNSISIIADAYANENIFAIRYVKWRGTLWDVIDVEVEGPRLLLRLGGVYNGPRNA